MKQFDSPILTCFFNTRVFFITRITFRDTLYSLPEHIFLSV